MTGYRCLTLSVNQEIPRENHKMLTAKIRSLSGIVSVYIEPERVVIHYRGIIHQALVSKIIGAFEKKYGKKANEIKMADYRREAIFSLGGFIMIQVLKKSSPQMFAAMKVFRSLFVLFTARQFIKNGIQGVWKDHQANADTLTATAVIASVLAGKPESSLTLLTLSNGAEMLTSYAAERARKQISGFLSLDQRYVWLIEDGKEKKVAIENIRPGAKIAVHLGEKICVDGQVVFGNAAVNQSSITGEATPAIKGAGAAVYAGSVLEAGELVVLVEKVGQDTSLARIVHLVEEAQTRRAPVQNFADRMANMLVPISFLGAAIVYGATRDWQRVLNLLFIDFSCGLKLSTAAAISAAIGLSAKQGILIKGGNYIEALSAVDTVVLDKTGTITLGTPEISKINTLGNISEKELILLAASAEQHSVHPLAVAIQLYVKKHNWDVPQHRSSTTIVARGMEAEVPAFENFAGGIVKIGSYTFMKESNVKGLKAFLPEDATQSILYVAYNQKLLGTMVIADPVRPKMKKTLNQLRRHGIDEIVMLTGDTNSVAENVAHEMDIDSYYAEILPEDKAAHIMKLQKHGNVMMVGDGINDAPALAFADVGVTFGGRRADLAVESSAVTIRSEDPAYLIEALQISQRTMNIIRQNFTATIGVNSVAMLLGALGKINPLWAAVIHNTATLAVVLNSARILSSKKKPVLLSPGKTGVFL